MKLENELKNERNTYNMIYYNDYSGKKFDMVDVQNATLSGGIAVGAVADLMLQPYGAFVIGTLTGIISTLGYRFFMVNKSEKSYIFLNYCIFLHRRKQSVTH